MDAAHIRKQLRKLGDKREALGQERIQLNADIAAVLTCVKDVEGLTMSEAARIVGVSRKHAYELLGK